MTTDKAFAYCSAPEAVRRQVQDFLASIQEILGANLTGAYLHGSLALGCFNPKMSDIDLLVATRESMDVDARRRLAECLLRLSGNPAPIEMSVLTADDRRTWRHPLPYDFHYSEDWREKLTRALTDGTWKNWAHPKTGDDDLAAHLTILHARGVVLLGEPIGQTFPQVPGEDYLASLLADVDEESQRYNIEKNPPYIILNLCRVLAYVRDGLVASKDEAGAWAMHVLPPELQLVLSQSLAVYRGAKDDAQFDRPAVEHFARTVWGLIQQELSASD